MDNLTKSRRSWHRRSVLKALSFSPLFIPAIGAVARAAVPQPRLPLSEFAQSADLVAALRKAVVAMKARKPSDPLSWFFQAAIHGVTEEKVAAASAEDPEVNNVDQKKYWNQCPHFGQNSANFLPWHRAYTYHFERIVRMHSGQADFALPYWSYTDSGDDRKFPKIYGIQYLDGNLDNDAEDNINPLWMAERDYYFTGYQHPLTDKLPLLALTDDAVDISKPMATPVFFGQIETEGLGGGIGDNDPSTRGLLESYPHDQIHRAVGGIIGDCAGAMAQPPTAGFDPVFCVHHTNIDRLWAVWACMPGKSWGALPPESWLAEKPWYFFDEQGGVINESRRSYFDHRNLGIRFKYEDPNCTPLELPAVVADDGLSAPMAMRSRVLIAETGLEIVVRAHAAARVSVPAEMSSKISDRFQLLGGQPASGPAQTTRILLTFLDVVDGGRTSIGFDVHVGKKGSAFNGRSDASYVGSIKLFNHMHHMDMGMPMSQSFDATAALAGIDSVSDIEITLTPFALLQSLETGAPFLDSQPLRIRGIAFHEESA
ncbi:tyrosinase family protein [Mesorhizobium kowhaii]|uniref:tyrosinase family protein n=1 Tax=Mesorhizobium kowhaii TaxID=1300272 RepID=UPI0035EC7894